MLTLKKKLAIQNYLGNGLWIPNHEDLALLPQQDASLFTVLPIQLASLYLKFTTFKQSSIIVNEDYPPIDYNMA